LQLDQVYFATAQRPLIFTELVVRAADPTAVANAVRSAILRVDRDQPVWRIRPLQLSIDNQLGSRKFQMRLLGGFAILAVVLALIGVYGVMSYGVASRTQEMGIRMALGAQHSQVVALVLRQGMRSIVIALVIGVGVAGLAAKALTSQLFGVSARDPLTFAAAPIALGLIALVACYLPARRASRVDPLIALRSD
jgi:putative ABC transport system permease protein